MYRKCQTPFLIQEQIQKIVFQFRLYDKNDSSAESYYFRNKSGFIRGVPLSMPACQYYEKGVFTILYVHL